MAMIQVQNYDTQAGTYLIQFLAIDDASEPDWDGIGIYKPPTSHPLGTERESLGDTATSDDFGTLVMNALDAHAQPDKHWEWSLRSTAALVRYARLAGVRGFTIIDDRYRPVEPSAKRFQRVAGVAWATDDVLTDDTTDEQARKMVASDLQGWHAWFEGDVFGVQVIGPDDELVEDSQVWGYYGWHHTRDYALDEAQGVADLDAERRTAESRFAGAGFVGLI